MSVDCSSNISTRLPTHVPSLEEIAEAFKSGLPAHFASVSVDVVECPDLSSSPFSLTAPGFGKNLVIAEVGGPGNLFPQIRKEKAFDVTKVCATCEQPAAFAFGPGAGPWPVVGVNCEMVADVNCATGQTGTRIARLDESEASYRLEQIRSPTFSLMANLAVSEPASGQSVVHIRAKKRAGATNFPEALRQALMAAFPEKLVSLGGFFILHAGRAKLHVMPDFPGCFATETEIGAEWLRYFEQRAPLVCATVMHTIEAGHKLRLEHTHCYSAHGDGGHYHYDTTPDEADYEGWFAPASAVYRIDEV